MFKEKSKIALFLFLTLFILSKSLVLLHDFSHQNSLSFNSTKSLDNQSFLAKIFHENKKSGKNFNDCFLCSFLNFQNQISVSSKFFFAASAFVLIFAYRFFDSSKLSFLLNSFSSRAPPFIS